MFTRPSRQAVGGGVIFAWEEDFARNCKTQRHNAIEQIKRSSKTCITLS